MSALVSGALGAASVLSGRFEVEREVGRGGIGIVYKALDRVTGQPVALKVIALAGVDASEEARFQREGRVLAGLSHPNIVRVVAFGQLDEGQPYVAMEWLEGEDLGQRLRRARLGHDELLTVGAQVADALAYAHGAGVVHRDVKPTNVFLVAGEGGGPPVAKLVDFGVASADDARITRTGAILGTPAYMAPEQARGDQEVDARADIYALGATLFEALTGRPPHVGPTPIAVLARLVTTPAPRLSEVLAPVPLPLDELFVRLLATDPAERPATAGEVADELRSLALDAAPDAVPPPDTDRSFDSLPPPSTLLPSGTQPKSGGGSRLVTSILATAVPKGPARGRLLSQLRAHGADATELGGGAIVAHLGVRKAVGDEATRALDLAHRLAQATAKVGVATGRTRIDRTRPIGEVVDRAAALSRDAQGGQVLADTTTSELARGRFAFQMRADGTVVVGPKVSGKKDAAGGSPFVGREADLAQVLEAFERCTDDRTPVVVTVTGAPGLGKTRLRREAVSRIASLPGAPRVALARCESFAKSHAFGTMADLARDLAGLAKGAGGDDALAAADRLFEGVASTPSPKTRELVARLLSNDSLPDGGDARAARDAIWIALTEVALARSQGAPLALVLEDAQWADQESLAWIEHVLARGIGHPLFVLAAARPALWRDDPKRFATRDHVRVELRPLGKRAVRNIARSILGDRVAEGAAEALADDIAAQAGGSPLFAEELARLAAQGRDAREAPTIEAAILAHLDALDEEVRDAATKLAVFGLQGWDAGLDELGVRQSEDTLRALAEAEVLVEQAQSRFKGTREFAFKHALTREVAYASLAEDDLKRLHGLAGRWLGKVGEDDATVARHLELAGDPVGASGYLEKAARRSLAASALGAAVNLAERALAFAEDKPTQFARALLLDEAWNRLDARAGERDSAVRALQESVHDDASAVRAEGARLRYEDACGGGPETSQGLEEVIERARAAGLVDEVARCGAALASRYAFAGELDRAETVAASLLALSKEAGLAIAAVDAWQTLAVVGQARGEPRAALDARWNAVHAATEAGLKTREATLVINVGFALSTLGARDEAREALLRGIGVAERIGSPGIVRHGQMNLLGWTASFGADPTLAALLEEPRAMADAAAVGAWVPHDRATLGALFYRGAELLREEGEGCSERARALLRIAAGGYRATSMNDVLPVALGLVAEAERACGEPDKALALAREAADLLDHGSPSLLNEAPVYLALHDACTAVRAEDEARAAIVRGLPRLLKRVRELEGTPYARAFLVNLAPNAGLLAAARGYGELPAELDARAEGD